MVLLTFIRYELKDYKHSVLILAQYVPQIYKYLGFN